jgi:hypothetical protein
MEIRTPIRAVHTYRQSLDGTPGEVLPLLCPVREVEWVSGWMPRLVLSDSGVVERDCVFTTPDRAAGPDAEAIWTVLDFDVALRRVEMLKVTPEFLVVRLTIAVDPDGPGASNATVTYRYTALGPGGEAFIQGQTGAAYVAFMREWENELNAYLRARRAASLT